MSLAALGCNPDVTGASLADMGGHAAGTLAFSPDGGLYILVQASESGIDAYDCCIITGNWQIRPLDATDDANLSCSICFPQVAPSDDEYVWGLVYGNGFGTADADIDVSAGTNLYATNDEGNLTGTAGNIHIAGAQVSQSTDVDVSVNETMAISVQWPAVDLIA